ncbi:MoaD/ThiS family protein [bacterium]|nr:MoaD/ThiS family protein [bacterium]
MARLRMFANLREAAGSALADVPGATVGEVLDNAVERFGPAFAAGLGPAKAWVNGTHADSSAPVTDEDEIALIPPVSGGTTAVRSPAGMEAGIVIACTLALFVANAISLQWLAVVVVLVAAVWALDASESAGRRDLRVGVIPALLGTLGAVLAAYRFGVPGLAAAVAGATLVALVWSIAAPRYRSIPSIAATVVLTLIASSGAGTMIVLRLRSEEEMLAFLVVAVAGIGAGWLGGRSGIQMLDPVTMTLIGAIGAGVVAAVVWGDEIVPILLGSIGAAIALVAGRNIGTLMRAGGFFAAGTMPGSLSFLDGLFPAAAAFWLLLTAVA